MALGLVPHAKPLHPALPTHCTLHPLLSTPTALYTHCSLLEYTHCTHSPVPFFLLLQGKVHVSAAALPDGPPPVNVSLGAGACFGEGALVATIRREASVTAMDGLSMAWASGAEWEMRSGA